MFGKKILSIVGLLFLGSQFKVAEAACNFDGSSSSACIVSGCTDEEFGFHYQSDKVVKVTAADHCDIVTTPGYYKISNTYYSISSDGVHTSVGLATEISKTDCDGSDDVGSLINDGGNGKLCAIDSATKADGAVKISFASGDYYLIQDQTGLFTGTANSKVIVSSSENAITKVDSSSDFHLVISGVSGVGTTLNDKVVVQTDLTAANLVSQNKYLVINGVETVSPGNVGEAIVITDTMALDSSFNGVGDVCVDDSKKIVTNRNVNYCGSDGCEKYYSCASDICNESTKTFEERQTSESSSTCNPTDPTNQQYCGVGYYIVNSGNTLLANGNGETTNKLFHCTGTSTDPDYCKEDKTTIGYLSNADTGKTDSIPYILCKATASTVDNGSGVMVTKSQCDAIAQPNSNCEGKVKLIYDSGYKLCIDGIIKAAVADSSFLVKVGEDDDNVFVHNDKKPKVGDYFVVVNMDSNGNVILNAQEQKKYRYAHTGAGTGNENKKMRVYNKGGDDSMCSGTSTSSLDTTNAKEYVLNYTNGDLVDYYIDNTPKAPEPAGRR